ncbi:hypothetical protein M2428_001991 [Arthrobacter sp. ES3-54]|nr:hypothetical protein [Arthrobacter sp. ES3-54]
MEAGGFPAALRFIIAPVHETAHKLCRVEE